MTMNKIKLGTLCAVMLALTACGSDEKETKYMSPVVLSDKCVTEKIEDYSQTLPLEECRGKVYAVKFVEKEDDKEILTDVGQMHVNNQSVLYFYPDKKNMGGGHAANFMYAIEKVNRARQLTLKARNLQFDKECVVSGSASNAKENVHMNINVVIKKDDPLYCGGLKRYLEENYNYRISEIKVKE